MIKTKIQMTKTFKKSNTYDIKKHTISDRKRHDQKKVFKKHRESRSMPSIQNE